MFTKCGGKGKSEIEKQNSNVSGKLEIQNVSGKCSKSTLGYLKTGFRPLVGSFATIAYCDFTLLLRYSCELVCGGI